MDFFQIIDEAKRATGVTTDTELARKLGVTKQTVSSWRKQGKLPDAVTCATLAGLTGIPLGRVLGIVGEARAISREEKAVWRKLAASAAMLVLGCALTLEVKAAAIEAPVIAGSDVHYAKFRTRARIPSWPSCDGPSPAF